MPESDVRYQYFATICVNVMTVAYGAAVGWPSSSFLLLTSKDTPLQSGPINDAEASWIISILCIGGVFGNLLFGWMSDKFGRKSTMLLVAIPQLLSWILIIIAENSLYLFASRFLSGLAGGGVLVLIPLYVTEISEDKVRGSLGSCLVLSCNIGILTSFILGNYLNYRIVPYVLMILPIIFIIGFMFLPETPKYLMKSHKEKEAEKSLRYFRNLRRTSQEPPEYFKTEIMKLRSEFREDEKLEEDPSITWNDFTRPAAIKAFSIGLALMALNQLCGCFAMLNYTATIFAQSGSTLSPNMCAIIVGAIQLLGSYFSTILVDRAGRKLLITTSAIGTGLGLVCLGMHGFLLKNGYNLDNFGWVPVTSFSFVLFIASLGVLTLPFVVLSEIMPPKLRTIGSSICMNFLWIMSFLMVKYLQELQVLVGMHGCMFIFAACSFAGAIFVILVVPETKGKSIDTILAMLE